MSKAYARLVRDGTASFPLPPALELACRTDSLAALRSAVDHGANSIRLKCPPRSEAHGVGHQEFQRVGLKKAVRHAFNNGCTVCIEVDAADAGGEEMRDLLRHAFDAGIGKISLASPALALYLRAHHPDVGIHFMLGETRLSRRVLELLHLQLGIGRVVLPRVVTLRQLQLLSPPPGIELEIQGCGAGCALVIADERRATTGMAGWDTTDGIELCAGPENAGNDGSFVDAEHCDPAPLSLLPELHRAGVRGLIIEASTRSPSQMAQLTATWREAIDRQFAPAAPSCRLVSLPV
jgi:collagenase-like PrtC family protease